MNRKEAILHYIKQYYFPCLAFHKTGHRRWGGWFQPAELNTNPRLISHLLCPLTLNWTSKSQGRPPVPLAQQRHIISTFHFYSNYVELGRKRSDKLYVSPLGNLQSVANIWQSTCICMNGMKRYKVRHYYISSSGLINTTTTHTDIQVWVSTFLSICWGFHQSAWSNVDINRLRDVSIFNMFYTPSLSSTIRLFHFLICSHYLWAPLCSLSQGGVCSPRQPILIWSTVQLVRWTNVIN